MTDRDDTPAFPTPFLDTEAGRVYAERLGGMSLRDWFAGQALAGLCAFSGRIKGEYSPTPKLHAQTAYEYADAMMAARKEKPDAE